MTMRAAVVGCGRVGSAMADDPLMKGDVFTHAHAYSTSDKTSLVALCDTDESTLRAAGARWNISALFTSAAEMMAATAPEIVSICTPTPTHLPVARNLLDAPTPPRGILCEKPLAPNVRDAEELVSLAESAGVTLATIYMRRYAQNFRALKSLLDSGELGRIKAISGWYIGGVVHNGTHWFDMLRYFAGEVRRVHGLNTLREEGPDPTLDVALGLQSGAFATLRAVDARRFTLFEMDIVTELGRAQITDSGHLITISRAAPSPRYTGYTELVPAELDLGDRRNLMLNAVEDTADAVMFNRQPLCTGADGLAALRIAEAALHSLKDGTVVEVDR